MNIKNTESKLIMLTSGVWSLTDWLTIKNTEINIFESYKASLVCVWGGGGGRGGGEQKERAHTKIAKYCLRIRIKSITDF